MSSLQDVLSLANPAFASLAFCSAALTLKMFLMSLLTAKARMDQGVSIYICNYLIIYVKHQIDWLILQLLQLFCIYTLWLFVLIMCPIIRHAIEIWHMSIKHTTMFHISGICQSWRHCDQERIKAWSSKPSSRTDQEVCLFSLIQFWYKSCPMGTIVLP